MARLIASIFLCGLFLTPLVASALEPVKGPEFKLQNSRERGNIYERNFQRRETIATYKMLDDFFSPEIHDGKITRSIIYYVVVYCEEMKQRVTATELFSGQMASGSSWVGSASGKLDINDITQKKYCD